MNELARKARFRLEEAEREFKNAKLAVEAIERQCGHRNWGQVQDVSIRHEGYHDPGDAPGTMGVDRRLPTYIPPRTEPRFRRVCLDCGKVQETSRVETINNPTTRPVFPG